MTHVRRTWTLPTYVGLVAVAVLALSAPDLVERVQWLPLLLSLPLLGMAHGAVDHNVPARLLGRALTRRERWLLIGGYAVVAVLLMGMWWVAPVLALGLFLLVAILHWGDGDLWFCESVNGRSAPRSAGSLIAFVLARGLLPIGLPLLLYADAALPALDVIVGLFGRDEPLVLDPALRLAGLGAIALIVLAAIGFSVRDNVGRPRRVMLTDVGELVLLAVFFSSTQPVFAVGAYFLLWHSPRHILRLMASDPTQRTLLDAGRSGAALVAFHREAWLFTVVPLLGIAAIAIALTATGAPQIAAISLAAIAALTYPHAAVVAWMDHRQGVWRVRSPSPPDP